jgi:hypothetical protein
MISKEQLEIIAREKCPKAAKILGIELKKVRYYRRRIVEGHINIVVPKRELTTPRRWTTEEDRTLMKEIENSHIAQVAMVLKRTRKDVQERFNLMLKKEKVKLPILDILIQFPDMLPSQVEQMKSIYEYSPQSALRYCQIIKDYDKKYVPNEEQINSL